MANNESNFTSVSLPKELAEEIMADATELAKQQSRIKPISRAEMIAIAYRFYKQRKGLK